MTGETAAALTSLESVQALFTSLTALYLTNYKYPPSTHVADGSYRDYLIVGGGSAGCVLANRLSASGKFSVLLIEAGPVAPMESEKSGLFPTLPMSAYDWNYYTTISNKSSQYIKGQHAYMTAGKMLGGSSSLDHTLYKTARPGDYDIWAKITNDSSWEFNNLLPYIKKIENVFDTTVTESCDYASYHGFNGPLKLTKEPKIENIPYINSFVEMGLDYLPDLNGNQSCGIGEPFFTIFDSRRQSAADAYLSPARNRTNLEVMLESFVTKINFDSNNKATGVQVVDSSGTEITINAIKEIIVCAGAIGSPALLLRSGIGNKTNLEAYNITTISALPVGENLIDQPYTFVPFAMEKANASTAFADYGEIPIPVTYVANSFDNCSLRPDFELVNLHFTPNSSAFLQCCGQVYKLDNSICDKIYKESYKRNIYLAVASLKHPTSKGRVSLQSANYSVPPLIEHGIYKNSTDLKNLALYLQDFYNIVNTTHFKNVGAYLIDLDLPECANYDKSSKDFWYCYTNKIFTTSWQISSTCAIGPVLDNDMNVKGVDGLRVCDASAFPGSVSAFLKPTIFAMAEKLSDKILLTVN